jgi:hypothetical protein
MNYTIEQGRLNDLTTVDLPITNNAGTAPQLVMAKAELTLGVGDVLILSSKVQVRVDMTYNTLAAGWIRHKVDGVIQPGNLARPMGENVTVDRHYRIDQHHVHFTAAVAGVHTFEHVMYGASTAYTGNPAHKIVANYAEREWTLFRVAAPPACCCPPVDPQQ